MASEASGEAARNRRKALLSSSTLALACPFACGFVRLISRNYPKRRTFLLATPLRSQVTAIYIRQLTTMTKLRGTEERDSLLPPPSHPRVLSRAASSAWFVATTPKGELSCWLRHFGARWQPYTSGNWQQWRLHSKIYKYESREQCPLTWLVKMLLDAKNAERSGRSSETTRRHVTVCKTRCR